MKRIVILAIAVGLIFCSTASAFQRGAGKSTKTGSSKKAVARRRTSGTTSSLAHAKKVRTVTGHLCGDDHSGPYIGTIYLRVRRKTIDIQHQFRVVPSYEKTTTLTRYINHPEFDKIGFEYVVRYRIIYRQNWAISIRRTGRRKKIKACLPN
jgi:hypothetical protein